MVSPYRLFRLKSKRRLKNLMMTTAGCDQRSAGIGNIAYVKDLQTEKIVSTKLRCSKFGFAHHQLLKFGWVCTQKSSRRDLGAAPGFIIFSTNYSTIPFNMTKVSDDLMIDKYYFPPTVALQ